MALGQNLSASKKQESNWHGVAEFEPDNASADDSVKCTFCFHFVSNYIMLKKQKKKKKIERQIER